MINDWLDAFKTNWINHDIEGVLALFNDTVEYWESPSEKLNSREELRAAWHEIQSQNNIKLEVVPVSVDKNRHTVTWQLSYVDANEITQTWAGTYSIELNDANRCTYFLQATNK
jgi:hypothetical protein